MELVIVFLVGVVVGAIGILVLAGRVAEKEAKAELAALARDFDRSGLAVAQRRPDGTLHRVDPKTLEPGDPE